VDERPWYLFFVGQDQYIGQASIDRPDGASGNTMENVRMFVPLWDKTAPGEMAPSFMILPVIPFTSGAPTFQSVPGPFACLGTEGKDLPETVQRALKRCVEEVEPALRPRGVIRAN